MKKKEYNFIFLLLNYIIGCAALTLKVKNEKKKKPQGYNFGIYFSRIKNLCLRKTFL